MIIKIQISHGEEYNPEIVCTSLSVENAIRWLDSVRGSKRYKKFVEEDVLLDDKIPF